MTTGERLASRAQAPRLALAIGALVLGVLGALVLLRQRGVVWAGPSGNVQRVTVDPFRSHATQGTWSGEALAESVAARLAGVPGLAVRMAGGTFAPGPDLTVRGDIRLRDGRLVITARLYPESGSDALWTATFWRKDSLSSEIVSDLAAGLAEAIAGHLARGGVTKTGVKP